MLTLIVPNEKCNAREREEIAITKLIILDDRWQTEENSQPKGKFIASI